MISQPITGERLILRKIRESDVTDAYVSWLNNPETNRYLEAGQVQHTRASLLAAVREIQGQKDVVLWAILDKSDNTHIGNIKLGPIHPQHRRADVGFMIGAKKSWNKGYASEAIGLVVNYAFNELKLHKLIAGCYEHNKGSQKALENNGFRVEGVLQKHLYVDGAFQNDIRLALFNDRKSK